MHKSDSLCCLVIDNQNITNTQEIGFDEMYTIIGFVDNSKNESFIIKLTNGGYLYDEYEEGGVINYRCTFDSEQATSYNENEVVEVFKRLINKIKYNIDYQNHNEYILGIWIDEEVYPEMIWVLP